MFWSFRLIVGLGLAMVAVGLWSAIARLRGTLYRAPWLHRAAVLMAPSGFLAVLAGWVTTEVGRQPWTVYGLMRTVESASPLDAAAVGASLIAFVLVYFAVFGAGTFYLLRLMVRGPAGGAPPVPGPVRAAALTPGLTIGSERLPTAKTAS